MTTSSDVSASKGHHDQSCGGGGDIMTTSGNVQWIRVFNQIKAVLKSIDKNFDPNLLISNLFTVYNLLR